VATDGKTLRGSFDRGRAQWPLHRVSAWASERRLVGPAPRERQVQRHWSIENSLHWVLDVTFREDDSRVRDPTAARHFALLRKMALNLVGQDRSTKHSLRAKRKKAAWDDGYMQRLLWGWVSCVSPGRLTGFSAPLRRSSNKPPALPGVI